MKPKVVGGKNKGKKKKVQHMQSSHNCETVTVITAAAADGTPLPLSIIFKGSNISTAWIQNDEMGVQWVFLVQL